MNGSVVHLRTAFVSDVHLGSRDCRAAMLLDFLRAVKLDTLILVGDIIDLWSLRKRVFWPQQHNDVVRMILQKARAGTRVIYVPGNHDAEFRELAGAVFGNLEIHREHVHVTAEGLRLLVVHGDELDGAVKCSRWLAWLGSEMYDLVLAANRAFNRARGLLGFPYWSLAAYLKEKTGNAMEYVNRFEHAALQLARQRAMDGIVCGHIHRAALTDHDGILYCNDGDWVENCSTLVEDMNGRLALWNWAERAGKANPISVIDRTKIGQAA